MTRRIAPTHAVAPGYFDNGSYFGGTPKAEVCAVGCSGPVGLGDASPASVAAQAGGQAVAYAQGNAQVQQLQAQGQQLYTQANAIAAAGTGAANGNLSSVLLTATLTANNIPPGTTKAALQGAIAAAGGAVATASVLGSATAWLVANGFLIAGSAAAAAIPVVGTAVLVMVLAMQYILAQWGASSPTVATPGVVTALLAVPIPSATSTTPGASATPQPGEPGLLDPTKVVSNTCAGTTAGGALAAWRDFLDMAAHPGFAQPTTQRGTEAWPPPGPQQGNGFSLGCATWQACAVLQEQCVGFAAGGDPIALAAIALAVRWVPLGDPWVAPYQDTFSAMGAGANGAAAALEGKLINLAYTLALWPQANADQQALQYLTTLAWVWNNFPGVPAGPLPGWISYKLGHLQALVAADALITPAPSAANVALAVGGAAAAAAVAGPVIFALATGRSVGSVFTSIGARLKALPRRL